MRKRACLCGAVLMAAVVLGGCASVPLATMWRMRKFSVDDMLTLEPAALRAAVSTHTAIGISDGRIDITLTPSGQPPVARSFPLEVVAPGTAGEPVLPAPRPKRHWVLLRLTPAAAIDIAEFRERVLACKMDRGCGVEIWVPVVFEHIPDAMRSDVPIEVLLRLKRDEKMFTLIKETDLEMSPTSGGAS